MRSWQTYGRKTNNGACRQHGRQSIRSRCIHNTFFSHPLPNRSSHSVRRIRCSEESFLKHNTQDASHVGNTVSITTNSIWPASSGSTVLVRKPLSDSLTSCIVATKIMLLHTYISFLPFPIIVIMMMGAKGNDCSPIADQTEDYFRADCIVAVAMGRDKDFCPWPLHADQIPLVLPPINYTMIWSKGIMEGLQLRKSIFAKCRVFYEIKRIGKISTNTQRKAQIFCTTYVLFEVCYCCS